MTSAHIVFLASGAATAQKNIACLKIALKGLVIGALAFLSFFLRQMVRVNTRNDEYIT